MSYEIAIISSIFAVGNILFGRFEEMTPRWKRLLKFLIFTTIFCSVSWFAGRTWFHILLGIMMIYPLIIHLWWLPRKGINGWTAEPKEKYYKLRGWKMK